MNLFGILKETGVDDTALMEFYSDYFSFPLYRDNDKESFRFLGNRQISVWKLLRTAPKVEMRYRRKKIVNIPFGGDIFTQGGILLFDKTGNLQYVYYERYGDELDMEALRFAIHKMTRPKNSHSYREAPKVPNRFQSSNVSGTSRNTSSDPYGIKPDGAPRKPTRTPEGRRKKSIDGLPVHKQKATYAGMVDFCLLVKPLAKFQP